MKDKMAVIHEYKVAGLREEMVKALKSTVSYPSLVKRHKYLVYNFFRREFYGRFKGSILGIGWVLIHPVFLFFIYYLVFGILFQWRGAADKPETWYPIYLFSGIVVWMLFSETALQSCTIVVDNGNLIKKVAFPSELLPFPKLMVNILVFLVGVGIILFISGIIHLISPEKVPINLNGYHVLFFVPLVLEMALFTLGFSLLLATLHVFIRDTFQIFSVVVMFWFFVTPIFWHKGMVKAFYESLKPVMKLNPMFNYLQGIRASMGIIDPPLRSAAESVVAGFFPAVLFFLFGCFLFNLYKKRFADEV